MVDGGDNIVEANWRSVSGIQFTFYFFIYILISIYQLVVYFPVWYCKCGSTRKDFFLTRRGCFLIDSLLEIFYH